MMKLRLQVPPDREGTAAATLALDGNVVAIDDAAASVHPLIAKKLGNADCDPLRAGGHPPFGAYRLHARRALEGEQRNEYGAHALAFEPTSGKALEAESYGRLGLLLYGGRLGKDGRVRRTQGGVRLTDALLDRVVSMLASGKDDLELELVPVKPARWWAFWRQPVRTHPLSAEPPGFSSAPLDELTLLQAMLASAPRRPRTVSDDRDDRTSRDRDSSSSSSGEPFKGGGGEFGGAGASGRWDAPGGVDQAGRIVAGVAAGAAIAGIAAAAAADARSDESGLTDTTGGTSY